MKKIKQFAPSVLRYGIALVVIWFGTQQFMQPSQWTAFVPSSIVSMSGLSAATIVFFNACFETVFGMLLLFGWRTRFVALLIALHLFDIMYVVGYGEIGIRDFGLAVGALSIFLNGTDILCIDAARIPELFKETVPPVLPMAAYPEPAANQVHEQIIPKTMYGKF